MAVTDAYASAAEYRAAITKSDTSDDTQILVDLTSVSRWLERRLGRFFTKDDAAVARVYVPSDARELDVDELVSVSEIIIDENNDGTFDEAALAATDYELLPRNAALGAEARPYTMIRLTDWGTKRFSPHQQVRVTAVYGWPAVPSAIKNGTIQLTAILRLETPRAQAQVNELGQLIQMSPQARHLVDDLVKWYGKLAVA